MIPVIFLHVHAYLNIKQAIFKRARWLDQRFSPTPPPSLSLLLLQQCFYSRQYVQIHHEYMRISCSSTRKTFLLLTVAMVTPSIRAPIMWAFSNCGAGA